MAPVSRRSALRALGMAGAAGMSGCAVIDRFRGPNERVPGTLNTDWTPPADEWRLPAADLRNTARSSLALDTAPTNGWRTPPESGTSSGTVPVASRELAVSRLEDELGTVVRGLDPADGTERWRRSFETTSLIVGGLVEGTAIVGDETTRILALDSEDGATEWEVNVYDRLEAEVPRKFIRVRSWWPELLVIPDEVLVQTAYGVHGLDRTDGSERWRVYLGDDRWEGPISATPQGIALVDRQPDRSDLGTSLWASYGSGEPTLLELRRFQDEFEVSRFYPPDDNACWPVKTDEGICLTTSAVWGGGWDGPLVSGFDGSGRHPDWEFPGLAYNEYPIRYSALASDGGHVFVSHTRSDGETAELVTMALVSESGQLEWIDRRTIGAITNPSRYPERVMITDPVVAGDTLVVGFGSRPDGDGSRAETGTIIGLATESGTERWRRPLDSAPMDISIAGERVYVGGADGTVTALSPTG